MAPIADDLDEPADDERYCQQCGRPCHWSETLCEDCKYPADNAEETMANSETVNSPAHYTVGGIETIDYLRAKLTEAEFAGFCLGNALKYLSRAGRKGDAIEDYRKARWYLDALIGECDGATTGDQ